MIMKKYLAILFMMLVSTATFAEEGDKWGGVNLSFGFNNKFKNFGVGGKFQYEIKENLRLEGAANYFFRRSNPDGSSTSMWDVNVNAQYLIHVGENINVYPIIGPSLMTYKTESITGFHTRFGVNLGAGAEYRVNEQIKVNFDFKYQYLKDIDRPVIAIGAAYML